MDNQKEEIKKTHQEIIDFIESKKDISIFFVMGNKKEMFGGLSAGVVGNPIEIIADLIRACEREQRIKSIVCTVAKYLEQKQSN
jgi:signal recognition particle receptor subunit beta